MAVDGEFFTAAEEAELMVRTMPGLHVRHLLYPEFGCRQSTEQHKPDGIVGHKIDGSDCLHVGHCHIQERTLVRAERPSTAAADTGEYSSRDAPQQKITNLSLPGHRRRPDVSVAFLHF